jgi:hypothetical protein
VERSLVVVEAAGALLAGNSMIMALVWFTAGMFFAF